MAVLCHDRRPAVRRLSAGGADDLLHPRCNPCPGCLQFRVFFNSAAAVFWTSFVIMRARSIRSKGLRLPVFDLRTGQIADKYG